MPDAAANEMVIAECSVYAIEKTCGELMRWHHAEVETICGLDMDWEMYRRLEDSDALFSLVALSKTDESYEANGYALVSISPMLHERGKKVAVVDAFYLSPAMRRGRNGLRLIAEMELIAKERGCDSIVVGARRDSAAAVMLEHRRYTEREVVYVKKLEGV